MPGLESTLAAAEVGMLSSLDYRLPQVSNFVTDRKELTYYPLGGDQYRPVGVRVLTFQCSGLGFLDASSLTLSVQCNNTDPTDKLLKPLTCDLSCMIQEIRIMLGGVEVERLSGYGRLQTMMNQGLSVQKRRNDADICFGVAGRGTDEVDPTDWTPVTIPAGHGVQVLHKINSGITTQRLFIPLWALQAGGLTVEIMLVGAYGDAIDSDPAKSQLWSWSNCMMHADVLRVDDEMMQAYSKFILSGKNLLIPFKTTSVVQMSISGPDYELAVPRQFARLNAVWVTFNRSAEWNTILKDGNHFYFPSVSQNTAEASCQVGDKKFPEHTYKSLSQFIYRYHKATGLDKSASHCATVSRQSFATSNWITCFDLETVPQANHSGLNTSAGSIVISFRHVGTSAENYPTQAVITLFYDSIAEIGDSGVSVSY